MKLFQLLPKELHGFACNQPFAGEGAGNEITGLVSRIAPYLDPDRAASPPGPRRDVVLAGGSATVRNVAPVVEGAVTAARTLARWSGRWPMVPPPHRDFSGGAHGGTHLTETELDLALQGGYYKRS